MEIEKAGIKVVHLLAQSGWQAFFVGGFVRNNILKIKSDNIDIATDALPETVEEILAKAKIKVKPVGKKYGSLLAIVDSFPIEITTFRAEGRYTDNRHPDKVEYISDYKEDAKRRDFTINALYFDPIKKEILDPTGRGLADLKAKLIRFVGDPKKRIDEDGLRMLRGVRLAAQLGFKLEKNSFAAIKTRAKYIQGISVERIKAELDKILISKNRGAGMRLLDEIGLLKFIIPETQGIKAFFHKSKKYHLEGSMWEHTLLALNNVNKPELNLVYALLFHDIGKPLVAKKVFKVDEWVLSTRGHGEVSADIFLRFAKKYKLPKTDVHVVEWLIRNHMTQTVFGEMGIQKQLRLAMHPQFGLLVQHWECDELACKRSDDDDLHSKKYIHSKKIAADLLKRIKKNSTLIKRLASGDLIMKLGKLKPGRQLGEKIKKVEEQIILGMIKNEKDLEKSLTA